MLQLNYNGCRVTFSQQPRTYIYVLHALYPHPLYLHFSNQRRIYTSSYSFECDQNIFMLATNNICYSATKDVYIRPSCTLPAANDVYIRPHKINIYRFWLLDVYFFGCSVWTFGHLDLSIMFNCTKNNQGCIYMSILQGFSKTLVPEVYIVIHMLQRKDFVCARQVKNVEDIALQNKRKGRGIAIFTFSYGFFGKT